MNYMSKIAKMLGVEMGEEFKIRFHCSIDAEDETYFLKENYGLCDTTGDHIRNNYLGGLLTGRCEIVKIPWKPKDGEKVWYFSWMSEDVESYNIDIDAVEDLALYKIGKLYRTREEAEAHAEEDKAYWKSIRKEFE